MSGTLVLALNEQVCSAIRPVRTDLLWPSEETSPSGVQCVQCTQTAVQGTLGNQTVIEVVQASSGLLVYCYVARATNWLCIDTMVYSRQSKMT